MFASVTGLEHQVQMSQFNSQRFPTSSAADLRLSEDADAWEEDIHDAEDDEYRPLPPSSGRQRPMIRRGEPLHPRHTRMAPNPLSSPRVPPRTSSRPSAAGNINSASNHRDIPVATEVYLVMDKETRSRFDSLVSVVSDLSAAIRNIPNFM